MDWIILTERDLFDLLNKSQLDMLKAEAVKTNDSGICNRIIDMIVSRIRAEIAASGVNMLDCNYAKIPPELRETALRLALEALQTRLPELELSPAQIRAADYAREILARVAEGKLPVSRPTNGIKTARKFAVAHGVGERKFTRKSTEGM